MDQHFGRAYTGLPCRYSWWVSFTPLRGEECLIKRSLSFDPYRFSLAQLKTHNPWRAARAPRRSRRRCPLRPDYYSSSILTPWQAQSHATQLRTLQPTPRTRSRPRPLWPRSRYCPRTPRRRRNRGDGSSPRNKSSFGRRYCHYA